MSDDAAPLLEVDGLVRDYHLPRTGLLAQPRRLRALHGVSLRLERGRSLAIVGESGCGKSTLARVVLALEQPTAGTVRLKGRDLFALDARELKTMRRHMQMVFQDPYGSLDPRQKVGRIVAEPLTTLAPEAGRAARRQRVAEVLAAVGLAPDAMGKYPHEFSGGQRQRIAIARALVTHPDLIVADEPVSALDVSVQAQVLNLMMDLQERHGLAYLFISHDLSVVRHIADDVAVILLGRIVEQGPTETVFASPSHPYTRALLDAVPRPEPHRRRRAKSRDGEAMPKIEAISAAGCPFASRCPLVQARCWREEPKLRALAPQHGAACHLA
jgi:peptide/nickel transport system ATP-binding protein